MASWSEFSSAEPELAEAGRRLLFQYGPGLAFIATVGGDGSPRLHPITVSLTPESLYAFIAPGPKQHDLERDGRYALHSFLPDEIEEEFMVAGQAQAVASSVESESALAHYHQSNVPGDHRLFRFQLSRALHATYRFRGDWPPTYRRWRE